MKPKVLLLSNMPKIHKNGDNLRRTVFFIYILISFMWILNINHRLGLIEETINQRTPLVSKFLEMETRVLQMERDVDLILKHHVELYEELKNDQQK